MSFLTVSVIIGTIYIVAVYYLGMWIGHRLATKKNFIHKIDIDVKQKPFDYRSGLSYGVTIDEHSKDGTSQRFFYNVRKVEDVAVRHRAQVINFIVQQSRHLLDLHADYIQSLKTPSLSDQAEIIDQQLKSAQEDIKAMMDRYEALKSTPIDQTSKVNSGFLTFVRNGKLMN